MNAEFNRNNEIIMRAESKPTNEYLDTRFSSPIEVYCYCGAIYAYHEDMDLNELGELEQCERCKDEYFDRN